MFLAQGNDLIPNKVYEDAQALLDVGTDIEEIRQKTGVTVGLGGELLFEISDKDATINHYKATLAAKGIAGGQISNLWYKQKSNGMFDVTMSVQDKDGIWGTETYEFNEETILELFPHETSKSILAGEGAAYNGKYMQDGLRLGKTFIYPLTSIYLHEILVHENLYKAYPSLKTLKVRKSTDRDDRASAGYVKTQSGEVFLELSGIKNSEALKKSILHETQHRIQDISELPQGSEVSRYQSVNPNHYFVSLSQAKLNRYLENNPDAINAYRQVTEFEDELRRKYPDSENNASYNLYEHLDENEAFATFDELDNLYERLPDELIQLLDKLDNDLFNENRPVQAYDLYSNSAGEIESQTVEIRSKFSQEELAKNVPYTDKQREHANIYYNKVDELDMIADYSLGKATKLHLNLRKQCKPFAKFLLDQQLCNVDITGYATETFLYIYQDLYRKLPKDNPICQDFEEICRWGGQTKDFHLDVTIAKTFHDAFNDFINHGASTNPSLNNAFSILKKWIKNTILLLNRSVFHDETHSERIFPVLDRMYSATPPASTLQHEIQKEILSASEIDSKQLAKAVATAIDCGYETLSKKAGVAKETLMSDFGFMFEKKPVPKTHGKPPRFGMPQN